MGFRVEQDSMGDVQVPESALYGAQTQRAVDNFPISDLTLPHTFIHAVVRIKRCAAMVNAEAGLLDADIYQGISLAAEQLLAGEHADQFPVDVFQTGSGTSTNMNVNEVLASLASRHCGRPVSPNDHVNMSQSSNDVIPTAIHLSSTIALTDALLPALEHLEAVIQRRADEFSSVIKTGRTHLMDAMPLSLGQELGAWRSQLAKNRVRLQSLLPQLCQLSQGGTAVGSGVNAPPLFAEKFCTAISADTGINFVSNGSLFEGIASQDTAVALSGQLRTLAVTLMKISNDLRWMNSGPLAGLGEIQLPALQPGSSIMPGKVNPVIPEAVAMVAAQVMGNDAAIAVAGQSGNFQLNVMLPLIAHNLLQSIGLLASGMTVLADKAMADFQVNQSRLDEALARNPILVTALNPKIGYLKAADIAKRAYQEGRPVLDVAEEMTEYSRAELAEILDPAKLAR
ncbi:class II fumarate hydratase [Spongiibacter taiwanensis]|uniref:class II fumarate hydratase n=1 Tax=Spongiibacter taiwanensis TaxID=1748242 RepID=UPI00203515FD|nr:class II fumarate hydratase [Spongiibacter taiwanensis]USA43145.1 class II fumarate hydratase [Spongiibacter taiwanensis]